MSKQQPHTKQEAGRRGGLATVARHGKDHMRAIGKRGAQIFHERYSLKPVGTSDFAIVKRDTGEFVRFLSGRPWALLLALLMLAASSLACSWTPGALRQTAATITPAPITATDAPIPLPSKAEATALPSPTPRPCIVRADALHLRAGPGMSFSSLAILREGESVTLQNIPAQGHWQAVKAGEREGWVNGVYLVCR